MLSARVWKGAPGEGVLRGALYGVAEGKAGAEEVTLAALAERR